MSVPEGKRSKGKLNIETESYKLLDYIFNITSKYYLPQIPGEENIEDDIINEQTKWFAERMRIDMLSCMTNIQEANKTVIEDDDSFYDRRSYQTQAERSIENVLMSATLMYRRKLLKSKRIKAIGEQTARLKRMIQNWRKSDKARYLKTQIEE